MTRITTIALILLVALGLGLRIYDLTADPPALFGGGGQDLTTDAAYLTVHARSAALFDSFDPLGLERWPAFKFSLITGVSYLLFTLFGVSTTTAALTGLILQVIAAVLMWLAVRPRFDREATGWYALFIALSWVLIVFARLPFGENAMLALSGLTVFIYLRKGESTPGLIMTGVLVGVAGLLGKSFGYLLIAGVLWNVLAQPESLKKRITNCLVVVATMVGAVALFSFLFHGSGTILDFLWQHSAGQHGFPQGLSSVAGFFENFISFSRTGFHLYTAVLSVLFWLLLVSRLARGKTTLPLDALDRLLLGWILVWVVALSVFNYLPVRYLMPLVFPMAILTARWLTLPESADLRKLPKLTPLHLLGLALLNWYAIYNLLQPFLVGTNDAREHFRTVWIALPISVVLTAALTFARKSIIRSLSIRTPAVYACIALAFVAVEGWRIVSWLSTRTHTIAYANADVAGLVSNDAVISGQYGPAVAFESPLRVLPHFFGDDPASDESILHTYPVSHIAVSTADLEKLRKQSPVYGQAQVISTFWMRDNSVSLVRLNLDARHAAAGYQRSAFERCIALRYVLADSAAWLELNNHLQTHPRSRSGLLEKYYLLNEQNRLAECRPVIDTLTTAYPDDFTIAILAAVYYRWLAGTTGEPQLLERAEMYFGTAIDGNPNNRENLTRIYQTFSPRQLGAPPREVR